VVTADDAPGSRRIDALPDRVPRRAVGGNVAASGGSARESVGGDRDRDGADRGAAVLPGRSDGVGVAGGSGVERSGGRCAGHSEAAFVMLAGVAPIPANSGQVTTRHRLNRYGDRHLNQALHTVVRIRIQYQEATPRLRRPPHHRRKDQPRDQRCLARYVARDLYHLLEGGAASA